ncbi:MAG: hypothetical protein RIB79_01885 [Allomuricauda sp.]|jgi:hypothetical protein
MRIAGNLLLILLSLLTVFHILVIQGVFPYQQTWGGAIEDENKVFVYEGFAIVSTLLFILIVSVKLEYLKLKSFKRAANIGVWAMVGFFTMSLIGNLMAKTKMERIVFIPISIILVVLSFRLAIGKKKLDKTTD